ncbi:conserved lipothrixviral protein [Sulfolobus islandicus filamentous virus 2]|uniref:Conserved lipothrixviral protein n=1 Tax=Sulfolobus islandicus filamentous virus 2 TaxID=1902331 RepID=A0A1D8BJ94_SIFV|nr:conserved lipothrixviral protein [Sulfolobus islandicus filamentous virus 2]
MSEQKPEQDVNKKIEELEKKVQELQEQLEKTKQAVKTVASILDNHLKGQWTLEDVKIAITHINEMVQLLTQSGIIRPGGEGNGNWLQMMLAQQFMQQKQAQQSQDVQIEPLKKKNKKKLKKFLDEEAEEEE